MRSEHILAAFLTLGLAGPAEQAKAEDPAASDAGSSDWKPLFNGRDLAGWYTFVNGKKDRDPDRVVQVHDGVIHMYKDFEAGGPAPFAYIATDREFENYDLRFEYRWGEK